MKYKDSGVNIEKAKRAKSAMLEHVKKDVDTRGSLGSGRVRGDVLALRVQRPGAREQRGRRGDETHRSENGGPLRHGGAGSREPLRQRHPRPGRAAALLSRLHRERIARSRQSSRRSWRGYRSRAASTVARSSAARRPRCPISTRVRTSISPGASSASSRGTRSSTVPPSRRETG